MVNGEDITFLIIEELEILESLEKRVLWPGDFLGESFSAAFAIDGSRDDATSISGTFTTRIKTAQTNMLEGVGLTEDTHGG